MHSNEKYPHVVWRPFFDLFSCYFFIFISIYFSLHFPFFYSISIFIIANRLLALSLLSHEALHNLLFKNIFLNNFVGRWFCAFPTLISLSRYRKLHLLHHASLYIKERDPDYFLYSPYPVQAKSSLLKMFKETLTLKILWRFTCYYTEISLFFPGRENFLKKIKKNWRNGDLFSFLFFYLILFWFLFCFNLFFYYLLFFIIPFVFITQPYVLLMGGLQHGSLNPSGSTFFLSRSITGSRLLMEILLPLNINFHGEHHIDAKVPHYWLSSFARDLENANVMICKKKYFAAIKDLCNQNIKRANFQN